MGQNLGAGKPERAEQAVWRAALYNWCFLGAVGLVFVAVRATASSALFTRRSGGGRRTRRMPAHRQRRVPVLRLRHGADAGVQRRRRHLDADLINLFCFWLWEIPLAWLLAGPLGLGPTGVFVAVLVAFSTLAVVSVVLFRRGRWKRVIRAPAWAP